MCSRLKLDVIVASFLAFFFKLITCEIIPVGFRFGFAPLSDAVAFAFLERHVRGGGADILRRTIWSEIIWNKIETIWKLFERYIICSDWKKLDS